MSLILQACFAGSDGHGLCGQLFRLLHSLGDTEGEGLQGNS